MAAPTPYERTYSFTDYQASNPSAPLPGIQVDNELENVETSLGEAIDAINDVRRSDGALKNGIVTVDSLSPTVAAGVGSGALASAEAAAASADAASDSAVAAAASATAASGSATSASGYASNALTSRNEAETERTLAQTARTGAQTARDFSNKWATEAGGVLVDDGVNDPDYSAYHYAQVALGAATGALPDNSVSTAKIVNEAVTRAKLATAVTDELDDKADAAATTASIALKLDLAGGAMTGPIENAIFAAPSANTKRAHFDLTGVTAGQDRAIRVPDKTGLALSSEELIYKGTGSGTAFTLTDLSAFRFVIIRGSILPASDAEIRLRTSTNNGSSYDAGATDYGYNYHYSAGNGSTGNSTANIAYIPVSVLNQVGNAANEGVSIEGTLFRFNEAAYMRYQFGIEYDNPSTALVQARVTGRRNSATARDALQFSASSGNIAWDMYVTGVRS